MGVKDVLGMGELLAAVETAAAALEVAKCDESEASHRHTNAMNRKDQAARELADARVVLDRALDTIAPRNR